MKPQSYETLEDFQSSKQNLAQQVEELERLMSAMEKRELTDDVLEACPSLVKAKQDNDRLRYRCQILESSIGDRERAAGGAPASKKVKREAWSASDVDDPNSILNHLTSLCRQTITALYPFLSNPPVHVTVSSKGAFGDYQCNSAMAISKLLKEANKAENPRQVAQHIVGAFPKTELVAKLDVAGPGFINIHLDRTQLAKRVASLLLAGVAPPKIAPKRVVVDMSSPNIAKEMHVGHLRSTIIGESLSRLFEFIGFDVVRVSHVGDWGTQFGMLIAHLQDKFPNYLNETPPVSDLQAFYKESKKRFDSEEEFKARAYECVVKLQSYDKNFVRAWQMICDVSRKDFERIYERLDISVTEKGESFYQQMMGDVVKELKQINVLKEADGRWLAFPSGFEVPLTIVKSDGGYTYDTSDMACIKYRLEQEKADWIIYVVDVGQGLHLQQIYKLAQDIGWYDASQKRVEHVGFGLVLGEDKKKLKTRSGDTIRLTDLLDEGLERAKAKLQEKNRGDVLNEQELEAAQTAVAYGCIKYADLSHNREHDYVFSFDRMLDDRGNTAVYLLYAYTRIRSIARTAKVDREQLLDFVRLNTIDLSHPSELKLAKAILKFPDCLLTVLERFCLHFLCDYLYELATTFSDFYTECYCIEKDADGNIKNIYLHRLALCEATADVIAAGCKILGLKTVDRM